MENIDLTNTTKLRISRVDPFQAGKVNAVLYALLIIPMLILMSIIMMVSGAPAATFGMMIPMMIIYPIAGFIMTVIATWLYNVVAKWTGGIEYEATQIK